jgi:hypothetical protein
MKSAIRKSLLLAVLGLALTAFASMGGTRNVAAKECCSPCAKQVEPGTDFCNYLIEVCGVQWFADPCEYSPVALCACATGCDPGC